ncbi:LuxR C-terminal-related transcriptional regulator [Micromonospora sp. WMMD882]|uniref:helix-turn-helix transcriptional regulator n=1 Tax=Micromonospora sp. WMMD882 TaxID=3015151 RepID=UPI00248BF66A|nr:LuxR C-terminal-related transcriptional regulator [Micromonospora sp. WMMD882]WBB79777.1 LuxR C-terminal-related transcriptional regulator [Micromonospora sp. WMMD882]
MAEESSAGVAGLPLLLSRLVAPAPPEPMVRRPRLLSRLDEAADGPVTLVRAPAGWGKTTLLAAWVRAAGPQHAWLTVEADDDGARLCAYLAAALSGPVAPEQLAVALAGRDQPVVLVLDDLHRVTEPAALAGLEFLLRHAGQRLRLVIGTRVEPALPLHRWRLSGELTTLDADDLAFTADEVAELLTAHGVTVSPATLSPLRERTAGWPAGLRFAALAARAAADPAAAIDGYAGDAPDVAGYLRDEVLAELTDDTVDLLRRVTLTGPFCGDLADALTGRPGGDGMLSDLLRRGGLVVADHRRPGWYRCHPLVTDLLRAELRRRPDVELRELHRRAAGWYAGHGRPGPALRHALAAGDWDRATALVLAEWPELVPYDPEPDGPAPAAPPEDRLARDPELGLALAVERAVAGDARSAGGRLRQAVAGGDMLPTPRRDRFVRLATALEIALARLAGDHEEVRAAAARLRGTLPGPPAGPGDDGSGLGEHVDVRLLAGEHADVRLVAGVAEALADLAEGRFGRAGARFRTLAEAARATGRTRAELLCRSRSALANAWWGRLREAERAAGDTLGGAAGPGERGHAYLALALVALHRDRPGEAEAHLGRVDLPATDPVPSAVAAYCRALLCRDRGDPAGARRLLTRARDDGPGPEVTDRLRAATADLDAARGDPATARDLLRAPAADDRPTTDPPHVDPSRLDPPHVDPPRLDPPHVGPSRLGPPHVDPSRLGPPHVGPPHFGDLGVSPLMDHAFSGKRSGSAPELAVALARIELRAGDPRAAAAALPPWDTPDAERWPLPTRLDAGLLDALLARRDGDPRRAGRLLERVLELAEPEGHRRVFTRADPPVRDLLAAHLDSGTAYWPFVAELRQDSAPGDAAHPGPDGWRPGAAEQGRHEPLTERELTILRYLQSILSNVEIAGELSLSVNTVKTHVRNIYRKLDATRRREAVRRARELHLL